MRVNVCRGALPGAGNAGWQVIVAEELARFGRINLKKEKVMKEIWWVRHGSTDWNEEKRWQGYTDVHLNERGRFEAECLAKRLRGIKFDGVWSSDM